MSVDFNMFGPGLFGFIIGVWANDSQRIQLIPSFAITPLTFLGGSFYSISVVEIWQKISISTQSFI